MTTADCTREREQRREYRDLLQRDIARYASARVAKLEVYCLLLATHPLAAPPAAFSEVIKYSNLLCRAFRSHGSAGKIADAAERNLSTFLRADTRLGTGRALGGNAFGIDVEVLWWLHGPFIGPDRLSILRDGAS